MTKRHICMLVAGVVFIGACGSESDGDDQSSASDDAPTEVADAPESDASDVEEALDELPDAEDVQEAADDLAEDLEGVQESVGGGAATFTANGQTWEFSSVLCAFGEDQIGQPGAVFNLSAIDDGLQLYASIDESGAAHSLSLNDIEDFENPSVSLSIDPFVAGTVGAPDEFLTLDDNQVSATVVMFDDTTGQPTAEPAEFTGTCP